MSITQSKWKKLTPDNREILVFWTETDSLKDSLRIASVISEISDENNEDVNVSFSKDSLTATLNPYSKKPLKDIHRKVADEITKKLDL